MSFTFGSTWPSIVTTVSGYPVHNHYSAKTNLLIGNADIALQRSELSSPPAKGNFIIEAAEGKNYGGNSNIVRAIIRRNKNLILNDKFAVDLIATNYSSDCHANLLCGLDDSFTGRVAGVDVYKNDKLTVKGARALNFEKEISGYKSSSVAGGADIDAGPYADNFIIDFSVTPPYLEIGDAALLLTFIWSYDVDVIDEQFITEGNNKYVIPNTARAFMLAGPYNPSMTFVLHAIKNGKESTKTIVFSTYVNQYWGKSPLLVLAEADILALSDNQLINPFSGPIDFVNSTVPEYMHFAFPQQYGTLGNVTDPISNVKIPLFVGPIVNVTNQFAITLPYRTYRSVNRTIAPFTWQFAPGVAIP